MRKTNKKILVMFILAFALIPLVFAAIQWSEEVGIPFETGTLDKPVCDAYGNLLGDIGWIFPGGDSVVWQDYRLEYSCYQEEGIVIGGNSHTECCPAEAPRCNHDTGECEIIPGIDEYHCSEFDDSVNCNNAAWDIAQQDIETLPQYSKGFCGRGNEIDENCYNYSECDCHWSGGQCVARARYKTCISFDNCKGQNDIIPAGWCALPDGDCLLDIEFDNDCTNNYRVLRWTATPIRNPPDCESGEKRLPCPAQLGFISVVSIIIAIILIIFFYFLIRKKQKHVTRRARRK